MGIGTTERRAKGGAVEGDVSRADVLAAIQTAMMFILCSKCSGYDSSLSL
jgi:hypothetical protein